MPLSDANISTAVPEARKLRLIDLFAFLTVAAVILAIAAPYLRGIKSDHLGKWIALTSIQLILAVTVFLFATQKRQQLVKPLGKSFGIAYGGFLRGRNLAPFSSMLQMLAAASFQLCLAWYFTVGPDELSLYRIGFLLCYQIQLGFVAGYAAARFMWRVYPSAVEFYPHGIVFHGTSLVPWTQVEVRTNRSSEDKLTLVIRQDPRSPAGETKSVQASTSLQHLIFQTAASAQGSSPDSPT